MKCLLKLAETKHEQTLSRARFEATAEALKCIKLASDVYSMIHKNKSMKEESRLLWEIKFAIVIMLNSEGLQKWSYLYI